MDRFAIQYDDRGVQLHNDYIGKIADAIVRYYAARKITMNSKLTYGMIHCDRKLLECWEKILIEEGLL